VAVIKFQAFIQEKKYLSVRGEKNPWFGHRYSPIPCPKCDKTHINPNLGKHHSKKTRLQMSKSRKRNPAPWIGHNWGKTPCLKCNKIHGNAPAKGKHFTENHKKKLAEAKRGKNNPMFGHSGENNPMFGHTMSNIEPCKKCSKIHYKRTYK